MSNIKMVTEVFTWSRFNGYEVSTKGDKRFSAFTAIMPDGRTIEQHYQLDIKGYQPGGTDWRLGKGKPPINKDVNLFLLYTDLWRNWAYRNLNLMRELYFLGKSKNYILSDCFATTDVNQAHALSLILNELLQKK